MVDDDPVEWKLRAGAIPGALLVALAFHAWPTGHFLQRTFLSMIVHEVGHLLLHLKESNRNYRRLQRLCL